MANYNKSFNFRNGVQVDEDDLIVRSSLVGIGTTIPRAELDVYGTIRSSGLTSTTNLFVAGIATFNDIKIGTGITIIGSTGVIDATFIGNGAGLYNIPTSQWVNVDPAVYPGVGAGYSSIYTGGTVGIATTTARSFLQIGGDPGLGHDGLGISSTGNVNATGVVTASSFVGSGAGLTSINASNISSGTLNSDRLPSNISISGIVTIGNAKITTLDATTGYINAGVITALSGTNLSYSGVGTIGNAKVTTLDATTGYINTGVTTVLSGTNVAYTTGDFNNLRSTSGIVTALSGTNLSYSGVGTIGFATITNAYVGVGTIASATITSGSFAYLNSTSLNVSGGISTVGFITATSSFIGYSTAINLKSGNVQLGITGTNEIDTSTGNLLIDSAGGTITLDDNVIISGVSTLSGQVNVDTGIVPSTSLIAYLGQSGQVFSEAHIDNIQIGVGIGNSNKITTSTGNLVLDASSDDVIIDANLTVVGITSLSNNLTLGSIIEPITDLSASLGSSSKRFSSAYVNAVRIGVAATNTINTVGGTELILDSGAGTTRINDNLIVSGIGSFGGNLNTSEITVSQGIIPDSLAGAYIGTSLLPFSEAYIDNITLGVSDSNEINTLSGDLKLNSNSNNTNILTRLNVSGVASFAQETYHVGISTFELGLLPNIDKGAYLGGVSNAFSQAYINEVTIGAGGTTEVSTRTGSLVLSGSSNLVNVQSSLLVDDQLIVGDQLNVTNDTFLGSNNTLSVSNSLDRVGIGTSIPEVKFQVRDTIALNAEFRSTTGVSKLGIGQSAIGAGRSTGHVGYSGTTLSIVNEDRGGLNFITHSGSAGLSTGGFKWIYGQTSSTLMDLSYRGKLLIGSNLVDSNYATAVAISTITGIGATALYIEGQTKFKGRTEIVGVVSVTDPTGDETNGLYFDTNNGTLTIKNLVVQGSTSGVTAAGVGVTVLDDLTNYGVMAQLNFTNGLTVINTGSATAEIGISTNLNNVQVIGIGTTVPRASLDVNQNTTGGAPFILPPRISTTTRDSFTPIAGAFIFNITTNKFQGYTGVAWTDFH